MTKLIVIKSGSVGNSYAIQTERDTLLLEAGAPLTAIRKHVKLEDCVACLVSHRHNDHAKYAAKISARVPVAAHTDVLENKEITANAIPLQDSKTTTFGGFSVSPFLVPHSDTNGSPCPNFAFLIHHRAMGTALFITDTFTCPFRVPHVNHFLIEANYDDRLLNLAVANGTTNNYQRKRIHLSHMSLDTAVNTIHLCGTADARSITLIHLSGRHADPKMFQEKCQAEFGIPTYTAAPGLSVPLSQFV